MPEKIHIHTEPVPPRVRPVGRLGIVDWREDCAGCHNCVKRSCIYGLWGDENETLHEERGYLDYIYQCKGCLICIQDCTKGVLTRVINPEYERLGDDYFTPEVIVTTWYQAETGHIPVSGAGYPGPHSGPGFDSMWTDMSEIVRPTRDGIHGREYISTSVDVGRKLDHLAFDGGRMTTTAPPLVEVPMPVIFESLPQRWHCGNLMPTVTRAAAAIGLFSVIRTGEIPAELSLEQDRVIPWLQSIEECADGEYSAAAMAMISDGPDVAQWQAKLKANNPDQIVAIRVPASPAVTERARELAGDGMEVIHLVFDSHGREDAPSAPRHVRDVLREVHTALVKDGTRDGVTISASGGIALAEHVTKAIVCGADLVAIDVPLGIALECRMCLDCEQGGICPIAMEDTEPDYGKQRVINLMGAWHQQLIEMLGAMGIREVRRLRGETGRCMFFEDLEDDTFGRLFGKRKTEISV